MKLVSKEAQNSNIVALNSELENHLEKIDFADLVKDAKVVAGFSHSRQFRAGPNEEVT